MPILKAETDLFPATLLDDAKQAGSDGKWWVVRTKSRQEKALARQLEGMSIPFYLPLVPQSSMIGSRRVKSLLPLFSSYVFVYGTDGDRIAALSTRRVAQVLFANNAQSMTKDLWNIRALIAAGVPLTTESRLEPGRRVRVKNGALMGTEGIVTARRGSDRLLVAVELLQQGVSIEISDFQVEPL